MMPARLLGFSPLLCVCLHSPHSPLILFLICWSWCSLTIFTCSCFSPLHFLFVLVWTPQDADAKMGLAEQEMYWGDMWVKDKGDGQEEDGKGLWPQCQSDTHNGKERGLSKLKGFRLQCSPKGVSGKPVGCLWATAACQRYPHLIE